MTKLGAIARKVFSKFGTFIHWLIKKIRDPKWLIVIITAIYAFFSWGQWSEMRKANITTDKSVNIAEKTLVASQRPWMSVDVSIGGDIKLTKSGGNIPIIIKVKNVGNSPAVGIELDYKIILVYLPVPQDILPEQRSLLARVEARSKKNYRPNDLTFVYMLFPGENAAKRITFGISRQYIDQTLDKVAAGFKIPRDKVDHLIPFVVGYVTYWTTIDESIHKTAFVAEVSRIDPRVLYGGEGSIDMSADGVPASLLRIIPYYPGSYAD